MKQRDATESGQTVFLGLGSNMGDARSFLDEALMCIRVIPGVCVVRVSPVYVTEPQGDPEQPWFANQVAELVCAGSPGRFLEHLQEIENSMGRTRDAARRFGPRVIDLDIVFFGNVVLNTRTLTLPHPRLQERAFVLVPLCTLAPDTRMPDGQRVCDLLAKLPHRLEGDRIFQSPRMEN